MLSFWALLRSLGSQQCCSSCSVWLPSNRSTRLALLEEWWCSLCLSYPVFYSAYSSKPLVLDAGYVGPDPPIDSVLSINSSETIPKDSRIVLCSALLNQWFIFIKFRHWCPNGGHFIDFIIICVCDKWCPCPNRPFHPAEGVLPCYRWAYSPTCTWMQICTRPLTGTSIHHKWQSQSWVVQSLVDNPFIQVKRNVWPCPETCLQEKISCKKPTQEQAIRPIKACTIVANL